MTDMEKNICNSLMEEGTVISTQAVTSEGTYIEFFEVEYLGETYEMTKHDGEWVYFHHC